MSPRQTSQTVAVLWLLQQELLAVAVPILPTVVVKAAQVVQAWEMWLAQETAPQPVAAGVRAVAQRAASFDRVAGCYWISQRHHAQDCCERSTQHLECSAPG